MGTRGASARPRFDPAAGTLDLVDARGRVAMGGLRARAVWDASERWTGPGGRLVRGAGAEELRLEGDPRALALTWRAEAAAGGVLLRLQATNTLPHPVGVERLDVLVAPEGLRGAGPERLEATRAGWMSWTYAHVARPVAALLREGRPLGYAPFWPPSEADRVLCPWVTRLSAPGAGSVLLGFAAARRQAGVVALQPALRGTRVSASCDLEGVRLDPGQRVTSEPLLVLLDVPEAAAFRAWAGELGRRMGARTPAPFTGWCSWYELFTGVSEAAVLANLDVLRARRDELPVRVVLVDDGWAPRWGDWHEVARDRFPRGLGPLADDVRRAGFVPGIWLAPFVARHDARLLRDHPDWCLRDGRGTPVTGVPRQRSVALDVTHPGLREHLHDLVRHLVRDLGFGHLKADFLFAAAVRGVRADRRATGVAAYRSGLALLRGAAGDGVALAGCGGLLAPSAGLVDAMRVSPDTGEHWDFPDPCGGRPAVRNAVRSTLAHWWAQGALWASDPDCIVARLRGATLTPAEVEAALAVIALSGGAAVLSDDLRHLPAARRALAARLLPPSGRAAVPLPPAGGPDRDTPERAELAWGADRLVCALFNWSDRPREVVFDPAAWSVPLPGRHHLVDLVRGAHLGAAPGRRRLAVPAHGVRLLAARAEPGGPGLLAMTHHLLGGAVGLVAERPAPGGLGLVLDLPGRRAGELLVWSGGPHGRLLRVPAEVRGRREVLVPVAGPGAGRTPQGRPGAPRVGVAPPPS